MKIRFFGGPADQDLICRPKDEEECSVVEEAKAQGLFDMHKKIPLPNDGLKVRNYRKEHFRLVFGKSVLGWACMSVGVHYVNQAIVEALDKVFGGHFVERGKDITYSVEARMLYMGRIVDDLKRTLVPLCALRFEVNGRETPLLEACRRSPEFAEGLIKDLFELLDDSIRRNSVAYKRTLGAEDAKDEF